MCKRFIDAERRAIEHAKYLEGCKTGKDPGNDFVLLWVDKYASDFRARWEHSACKSCAEKCSHEVKAFCERYRPADDSFPGSAHI
jgi:hypothetical protein